MNCDKILVIDEGKTIGYGNHQILLETVKVYQEIYKLQMGGGVNE